MILPDTQRYTTPFRPTHAVDILAFVEAQEISSDYFETPYYLQPAPGGEKAYALLRETLRESRKIGIAYVVIRARQHLAALVPEGQSLVLNTLRWASESGSTLHFGLPEEDVIAAQELAMMTAPIDACCCRGVEPNMADTSLDMSAIVEQAAVIADAPDIVVEELDEFLEDDDLADDYLAYVLSSSRHPRGGTSARSARTSHQLAYGARRRLTPRRG